MNAAVSSVPSEVNALKALLAQATQRAHEAEAALANARARETAAEAMVAHLQLRREQYGASAERTERLLAYGELELEDLEADAAEDELAAEAAATKTTTVTAFERKEPARKPLPDHLPRERVVLPSPCSCPACGGNRLSKLGEDVTERWR